MNASAASGIRRPAFGILCFLGFLCGSSPGSAQEGYDREKIQQCCETARRSLVGLEIHLQKKSRIERVDEDENPLTEEEQEIAALAESQRTLDAFGVVIDSEGTILAPDLRLKPEDVEKIVASASDGTTFEARIHAIGRHYDFVLLKPSDGAARKEFRPVSFEEFKPFEPGTFFYTAGVERVDAQWHVNVTPYVVTSAPLAEQKSWMLADRMRRGSILFDAQARPVGIPLDLYLWVNGERDSFVGRRILADERIGMDALEKKREEIRGSLTAATRKVEARLRENKQPEYGDDKSLLLTLYGLPIDERGTYLVPSDPGANTIRRIEELRAVGDGAPLPTEFVGSFKNFGAALVRIAGAPTVPSLRADATGPEPGTLYWTASIAERFGRVFVRVETNRVFRAEKGLKGAFRPAFRWGARPGAFLLDFDGLPVGIYTDERKPEDIDEAALDSARERYYGRHHSARYLQRIYSFEELKDVLADPAPHFDPRSVPMTTKKEKTLVWIGVEYQALNKPLAESFKIEDKDLTNEGKRGLLVTVVYPGSPGAAVGLQPDDILLSLSREGEAKATDLMPEQGDFEGRMMGRGATPWLPRMNYLTALLTQIGAGKKVTLEVLRGREKKSVEVTLEEGPTDFETADKYKDEDLGITVKELTYEVRHFQKMGPEEEGVVVTKIESGSRAEVGKLQPLSIITRINDVPVKDPAHFRAVIEKHRAEGSRSVTLTVLSFGQTRLADVELGGGGK